MKTDIFYYFHSNLLGQDFAIHKENYSVHFQDGTKYTEAEALLLVEKTNQEKISLHNLKKEFSGVIEQNSNESKQGELEL